MKYSRRGFLQSITAASLGAASTSFWPSEDASESASLTEGATILFQGDSITDAGRNRELNGANEGLGNGYAFLATAQMRHLHAKLGPLCYNRGDSGNKVFQLANRWKEDTLELNPDVLSILVGVNDFWHRLTSSYEGTAETYEKDLRKLLQRTRTQLPDTTIILGEPYAVQEGSAVDEQWYPDFRAYQKAARNAAHDYETGFIPFQAVFDGASQRVEPTYWTEDGVHPTLAGSHLMAEAWLQVYNEI